MKNIFSIGFILLVLTLLITILSTKTPVYSQEIILTEKLTTIPALKYSKILEDKNKSFSFSDIYLQKQNWTDINQIATGIGFSRSAYWLHFKVKNNSTKTIRYFIEFSSPLLDEIEVYKPNISKTTPLFKVGDKIIFSKRPVTRKNLIIPVSIHSGISESVYIRFSSESSLNFIINILGKNTLEEIALTNNGILMLLYGMTLIFILGCFIIIIFINKIYNIYYTCFIITFTLFIMSLDGTAFQILWPDSPDWAHISIPVFLNLSIFWVLLYINRFLNLKEYDRRIYKMAMILANSSMILLFLNIFNSYRSAIIVSVILAAATLVFILTITINFTIKRYRKAYFLSAAAAIFSIGSLIFILKCLGLIPPIHIFNLSLHITSLIAYLLLFSGFIYNIRKTAEETEEFSREMRIKVKERTQELFFSEIGINSYIDMINNLSGTQNEFVTPNAIQELIENDRATSLLSLSHDITIITDLQELLETMLKQLINISYSEGGCIFMINENKKMDVRVKNGIIEGDRLLLATSISEHVFKKGLPLIINNEEDLKKITGTDQSNDLSKLFILCIPITANNRLLGVCYLDNSLSASVYTENTKNLISTFLSQAALAIENSFYTKSTSNFDHNKRISSITETKINQAIEYLQNNYTYTISREGLASILDIHPDSLGRYFKMITGKKINEYVNELRVLKAAGRLKDEETSIIEIAYSIGFESLTTFNRAFLKIMKMNPTEYRETYKK